MENEVKSCISCLHLDFVKLNIYKYNPYQLRLSSLHITNIHIPDTLPTKLAFFTMIMPKGFLFSSFLIQSMFFINRDPVELILLFVLIVSVHFDLRCKNISLALLSSWQIMNREVSNFPKQI